MLPRVNDADAQRRADVSELILGVKCGGSDGFSGLSANPALGRAADLLVRSGGTVAHHRSARVLRRRAHPRAAREGPRDRRGRLRDGGLVQGIRRRSSARCSNENPSPGNVAGGLLNITIKSLGAIAKAGTTRVEGVTGYARAAGRGTGSG